MVGGKLALAGEAVDQDERGPVGQDLAGQDEVDAQAPALVKVTGKICSTGSECSGNTNPEAGMPTGSETFKQAYDKQLKDSAFSPIPCIRIKGKWYANAAT